MYGRDRLEAYVRGQGVWRQNKGQKTWRTGSYESGIETTVYDSHWYSDSHGIRVSLEYDKIVQKYVYTISLVYGNGSRWKSDDETKEDVRILDKFYVEVIEGVCPKCKGKNICNEKGRFICGCGFDYTEDSIGKLSEIDEYCKALKTGIGIKMVKVDINKK